MDVAQEGIWVTDDRGVITYVNQRMVELLGYQNGAMLGRPVIDFVDAGSRDSAHQALKGTSGTTLGSQDLRFRRRDGGEVWGLVSGSPIVSRDGNVIGTVGMVTDITERKQAEDRLRRSAERLQVLHDLDQAILAARSPAEIGRAALGRLRRMVPCQRCTIVLFDLGRGQAQMIAGYADGTTLPAAALSLDALSPIDAAAARHRPKHRRPECGRVTTARCCTSCAPRGFGASCRCRCSSMAKRSVRSISARAHPAHSRTNTGISRTRSRRHSRSRSSTRGFVRSSAGRPASWSAAWPSRLPRPAPPPPKPIPCSTRSPHELRDPLRHIHGFAEMILLDGGPRLESGLRHYATRIAQAADRMAAQVDALVRLVRVTRQDLLRHEVDLGPLVEDIVGRLQPSSKDAR